MVLDERTPWLPNWVPRAPALLYVFAYGTRVHEDAEFERQFVSNPPLTPTRILFRHCVDESSQVLGQWRATDRPGFPPPEPSLQKTPIDLQSLNLIDFHLLQWSAKQRLFTLLGGLTSMLKTSAQLRLENLALRQQLMVLRRSAPKRLKLTPADRIFWVWLRRVWRDWTSALMIVKAETVVA